METAAQRRRREVHGRMQVGLPRLEPVHGQQNTTTNNRILRRMEIMEMLHSTGRKRTDYV